MELSVFLYFFSYIYYVDFLTLFQELFHPSGEWDFLSGRFLDFLLDIGFCADNWSEKTCYHIAEFIFGYDDPNNNMVSLKKIKRCLVVSMIFSYLYQ